MANPKNQPVVEGDADATPDVKDTSSAKKATDAVREAVAAGDAVVVEGDKVTRIETATNADPYLEGDAGRDASDDDRNRTIVTPQTDMPSGTQDSGLRSGDDAEYDHGERHL